MTLKALRLLRQPEAFIRRVGGKRVPPPADWNVHYMGMDPKTKNPIIDLMMAAVEQD